MARAPRRPPPRLLATAAAVALVLLLSGAALWLRLLPGTSRSGERTAASMPQIVFAEFGPNADRIYVAPADDPARRTLVDTIEHAEGWGINPGAMANRLVA